MSRAAAVAAVHFTLYMAVNFCYSGSLSQSLDKNGVISDSTEEENYLTSLMLNSSQKRVFLCDSGKFNTHSLFTLAAIDDIE